MVKTRIAGAIGWAASGLPKALLAEGAEGGGGAPQGGGDFFGGFGSLLVPMAAIFLIWWVLVFRHEGKNRRQRQEMLANLKKGDAVRLTSGLLGRLWRVDGNEVVVIVDKDRDVKARYVKEAVAEVLAGEGKEGGGKGEAEGASA